VAKLDKRNAKRASRPNPREERNNNVSPRYKVPEFNQEPTPRIRKRVELLPRNLNQEHYIDLIKNEKNDIVIGSGPAGCGKTYIATLFALQKLLSGEIDKIIIARPIVGSGAGVGYLPGGIIEKLSPWCRPVLDILKEYLTIPQLERMLESEQIELLGLYACRGMTIKNCIMIFDESQNATIEEMKMVLTRMGDNSRIFITGDINQSDLKFSENGLRYVTEKMTNGQFTSDRMVLSAFETKDVVRHPVIDDVLRLFEK
jgi:phosphate starvation-inducible PhoH-like protein